MSNESVKPVRILTEFDLDSLEFTAKERSRSGLINEYALEDTLKVIASHRSLYSANAALSFKNLKYKETLMLIATSTTGLASNLKSIANSALEETK